MIEKRYLKWYNKIGYGSGDIAGNVVYLWLPAIFCALVTFLLTKLNVEKANEQILAERTRCDG